MTKNSVFLDTSFSIALVIEKDAFHERAASLADKFERSKTHILTTQAVILEIGSALSKLKYREAAIGYINRLISKVH